MAEPNSNEFEPVATKKMQDPDLRHHVSGQDQGVGKGKAVKVKEMDSQDRALNAAHEYFVEGKNQPDGHWPDTPWATSQTLSDGTTKVSVSSEPPVSYKIKTALNGFASIFKK